MSMVFAIMMRSALNDVGHVPVSLVGFASHRVDAIYPHGVYGAMRDEVKQSVGKRLKRIAGQVRGVTQMIDDDRYCIDVLTQTAAVRAALQKVEEEILRDHVSHCVAGAFTEGDVGEQRAKIEELVDTVGRMSR